MRAHRRSVIRNKMKTFNAKEWHKNYYQKNRKRISERVAAYYKSNPDLYEIRKKRSREGNQQQRLTVLRFYSKSEEPLCACCSETHIEFLAIDHVNGGGYQHRKSLGNGHLWAWFIKSGFPQGFQVLCHNCNMAKGFYSACPHDTYKQIAKGLDAF